MAYQIVTVSIYQKHKMTKIGGRLAENVKMVCISAESRTKYHLLRIDDVAYSAGFMDHKIKHQSKRRIPRV